jgi:folate-dependent phosphoribosylglycinamide formyltransferase PurN
MVFHTIFWSDSPQDVLFLVEENSGVTIHWVTHPFVVGQLVSKNMDTIVAKSNTQTYTGSQVMNMIINVPNQTFTKLNK